MTAINEKELLAKAEELVRHFAAGGTMKTLVGLTAADLEAIYSVAYSHFVARKYDKAIDLFKFLCLYDHTEPRWAYGLGVTRQAKGEHAEALQAYGMAVLLDVDDPRPQTQAGYCLMALERWPEAVSALEGAIMACGNEARHAGARRQAEAMLETAKARAAALPKEN